MAQARTAWNKGLKIGDRCRKKKLHNPHECPECGHVFYAYPSEHRTYCSFSCRSKATARIHGTWNQGIKTGIVPKSAFTSEAISGERHWNWKGGITPQDRLDRVRFRNEIQPKVFERDNYKCVLCGNGGYLQADHIKSWARYSALRFDMDNCRTLCMDCHYHITFGKPKPKEIRSWGHNLSQIAA